MLAIRGSAANQELTFVDEESGLVLRLSIKNVPRFIGTIVVAAACVENLIDYPPTGVKESCN